MRRITKFSLACFYALLGASNKYDANHLNSITFDFMNESENVLCTIDYHMSYYAETNLSYVVVAVNGKNVFNNMYDENDMFLQKTFPRSFLINGRNKIDITLKIDDEPHFINTINFDYLENPSVEITDFANAYKGNIQKITCSSFHVNYQYEKLEFKNYVEVMKSPVYHELNLSNIRLFYTSLKDLLVDDYDCYLYLNCQKGLFPRLNYSSEEEGYKIKLYLQSISSNEYGFRFNPMFYDEKTLMMSETSGDYFKRTSHFYLPYDHFEELKDLSCFIKVEKLGYDNLSFKYNFKYQSNLNFVGDCQTSAYCVETRSS